MKEIPGGSIDMILCDLPYGTTASKWDNVINFGALWQEYERAIKDNGAIVLFASGAFTHKLISSNESLYKYKWIWIKSKRSNFVNAKNRPMTAFEEVLVFSKANTANGSKNKMVYNPQGLVPLNKKVRGHKGKFDSLIGQRPSHKAEYNQEFTGYPCDLLEFGSVANPIHPTQKPVDLLEYLIKTYTNENETVLDNCMGSGSTGVACVASGRKFIGMEKDASYFGIARDRITSAIAQDLV